MCIRDSLIAVHIGICIAHDAAGAACALNGAAVRAALYRRALMQASCNAAHPFLLGGCNVTAVPAICNTNFIYCVAHDAADAPVPQLNGVIICAGDSAFVQAARYGSAVRAAHNAAHMVRTAVYFAPVRAVQQCDALFIPPVCHAYNTAYICFTVEGRLVDTVFNAHIFTGVFSCACNAAHLGAISLAVVFRYGAGDTALHLSLIHI